MRVQVGPEGSDVLTVMNVSLLAPIPEPSMRFNLLALNYPDYRQKLDQTVIKVLELEMTFFHYTVFSERKKE